MRPAASDDDEPETAQEPGPEAAATGAVEAAEAEGLTKGPLAAAIASAGSAVDSAISAAKEALRGSAPPDDSAPDAAAHDDTAAQPEAAAPQVIAAAQAEAAPSGDIGEDAPAAAPTVARAQVPASASKPPAGPSKPSADEVAARRRGRRAADVEEAEGHLATLKHGERTEPRVQIVRSSVYSPLAQSRLGSAFLALYCRCGSLARVALHAVASVWSTPQHKRSSPCGRNGRHANEHCSFPAARGRSQKPRRPVVTRSTPPQCHRDTGARAHVQATFGERPPSSNKFRARSGAVHARTFTARPAAPCPRRAPKLDFSHSPAQLERIENETRSLVTRLERVYGRDVGSTVRHASPPRGLPCNEAPHSRNRCAACYTSVGATTGTPPHEVLMQHCRPAPRLACTRAGGCEQQQRASAAGARPRKRLQWRTWRSITACSA